MPQYHAFLSYARDDDQRPDGSRADWSKSDESFMCRLYEALTAAGLNIWWDREKLESRGLSFSDEIRDAINDSRRLVLVVGPHAVLGGTDKAGQPITPKEWVQKEIEHAQTYCIGISPILRLGDYDAFQKIPYEFRKIARGDIPDFRNDADFDRAVKQLIRQLQGEVAPMGTLHGVPLLPTYYIKRHGALDELERKIRLDSDNVTVISAQGRQPTTDEQAVAVQGMGGIGKSTLAAAMAHDCDVRRMFPDGIYWVELKQTPNLALRQADLGARFGDDVNEYPDEQRGKQRLGDLLADKRALIILDDVWQKAHADAFLVRAPRCCFLLTTRLQALVDELDLRKDSEVKLNVLTPDEAIKLIEARLGAPAPAQHETFRQLHALLEGHTLALSLAAARLAKKGAAAAPEYLASLQRRLTSERPFFELDKLDEKQNKQLSVDVTLEDSYEALSEGMRRRFRLLGIFAPDGSFDAKAAAAVWDEPVEDVPEYLQVLVGASLLSDVGDGRYDQHALLWAHARARMRKEGEAEAAFDRYADYYIDVAEQFYDLEPEEWSEIDHDLSNIHFLGDQLVAFVNSKNKATLKRSITFAMNVKWYLANRRQVHRIEWLEMGLRASQYLKDLYQENYSWYRRQEALFLNELGQTWSSLGNKQRALEHFEQSLSIDRELGNTWDEAFSLNNIGMIWYNLGNFEYSLNYLNRALSIYKSFNDQRELATVLNNIGLNLSKQNKHDDALKFFELAMSLLGSDDDTQKKAGVLNNIGKTLSDIGDPHRALEFLEKALVSLRRSGNLLEVAITLSNIGGLWFELGSADKALEFHKEAIEIFIDLRAVDFEAAERVHIATALVQMEKFNKALHEIERSIGLMKEHNLVVIPSGDTLPVLEQIHSALVQRTLKPNSAATGTLPAETVQVLVDKTIAARTTMPETLDGWISQLSGLRKTWDTQGESWATEVTFIEALLAVLRGESPVLAESNPYAGVVAQVVKAVAG